LDCEQWYEHVPWVVETSCVNKVIMLRNKQVKIDRTISNNKPAIKFVLMEKEHVCL
jgi:hypothetical protein